MKKQDYIVTIIVAVVGCMLLSPVQQVLVVAQEDDQQGVISVAGQERTYWLHQPPSMPVEEPVPLVMVLHGGGGSGSNVASMSRMNEVADREGFMVAYPNGSGRLRQRLLTWNAGNCCGYALDQQIDDVAFIEALIDHLVTNYQADPARVYVTGMSNGGMMTYRVGCELSDKVTAIAPVAGALNVDVCEPTDPLTVVIFHGTADQHVLYEGGEPLRTVDIRHPREDNSVQYAIDFWTDHNECDPTPTTTIEGSVKRDVYADCATDVQVVVFTIEGEEHTWPGGRRFSLRGDEPTQEISASEEMWAIFQQHAK